MGSRELPERRDVREDVEKRPRRRMKGEERYRQLLQIATREFAHHGYGKVGTSDIARRADVAEPTIYRHFESKYELFVTTARQAAQEVLGGWRQAAEGAPSAAAALKAVARAFLEDLERRPELLFMFRRAVEESDDPDIRELASKHLREAHSLLAQLLQQARREGAVTSEADAETVAWALVGLGELAITAQMLNVWDAAMRQRLQEAWRALTGLTG
jgi:AcrR family transcriptional regulator